MNYKRPSYLYKYYSFDKEKHYTDILNSDMLYFSSPRNFNDPFDRGLDIIFKGKSKKYVRNYLIKKIIPSSVDKLNARNFIDRNYSSIDPNIESNERLLKEGHLKFVLSSGVCCFSELNNNILMWSHYADKHAGFCIQFKCEELIKSIFEYNKNNNTDIYPHKVIYKKEYPKISGYGKDIVDSLFIKASLWKYEKEWRFSCSYGSNKKVPLPENVVSAIYMGLEIDPCNESLVEKIVSEKEYDVILYKARKIQNKYALYFEKVNQQNNNTAI